MQEIENLINQKLKTMTQVSKTGEIRQNWQKEAEINRAKLKLLSNQVSLTNEEKQQLTYKGMRIPTVNELLRMYYKKELGVTELNLKTYKEWRELGYRPMPERKPLLLWGLKTKKEIEQDLDDDGYPIPGSGKRVIEYCPVLYLYDKSQVYNIEDCR